MKQETRFDIADRLERMLSERFREMTRESQADLIWVYKQQEPTLEGDEKLGCQRLIRIYERIYNNELAPPFRVPERLKWNTLSLREQENIVKLVRGMYRDGLVTGEALQEYQHLLAESREKLLRIPAPAGQPN